MATLNRITQNNNKKPEYKDYMGFLGNYKNGKEEQNSVYSSDSGISSVQSFSLNSSVNNSSTSINSDLSTNTQISCNSVDVCDNVSNCVPLGNYLENYSNRKYGSVQFQSDTLKKKQNRGDNKTVKTELFIQVNNEENSVSQISKTFELKTNLPVIKRQNSIKNTINVFENNDRLAKTEALSTLKRSNSKNKRLQKVINPKTTEPSSVIINNSTNKINNNPNPEFARIQKLITVNLQENGRIENKQGKIENQHENIPLSPKAVLPKKSHEVKFVKPNNSCNGMPPLPPMSHKSTTNKCNSIPPPPPFFSQESPVRQINEPNIIPVPPPFDFADKNIVQAVQISKPVGSNSVPLPPPPPPPMMPNNFVAPKFNRQQTNGLVNNCQNNKLFNAKQPSGYNNILPKVATKAETLVPVANENGIDKNNPLVKKLVYNTLRGMYGAYHDQANSYINTLPKHMVKKDNNLQGIIENIAEQNRLPGPGSGIAPPPPPLLSTGHIPAVKLKSHIPDRRMDPPPCVQNAMMTKDKKPFTYTPGGIDLSEIKSPRMARRIERNANYGGVSEVPKQPPPVQNMGPLPPLAMAAMQPQMHVQVFPSGEIPSLPSKNTHGPPPPPPPPKHAPPPPPPMQPLPTQKVMTGDNQVLERPDMTKIIPENPMSLLRKTGGPKPRGPTFEEQMYNNVPQQQPCRPPQVKQAIPESARYQDPINIQRNDVQRAADPIIKQPEYQYRPEIITRSEPVTKNFQPPIEVITRQPPQEQSTKTSTAHLGSLYIPPINQQSNHSAPSPIPQQVKSPPTPPERNTQSPKPQSPGTPTLNKAPRPWQQKQNNQQELPSWAKRDSKSSEEETAQPVHVQVHQQSPPSSAISAPTQRWGHQTSPKSPPTQAQSVRPSPQMKPQPVNNSGDTLTIRVDIITHDEHNRPCSPHAIIVDPISGVKKTIPIDLNDPQKSIEEALANSNFFQSKPVQKTQNVVNNSASKANNSSAVFVSQPAVFQHPGGPAKGPTSSAKVANKSQQNSPSAEVQKGTRVIPIQIEAAPVITYPPSPATPNTPGANRQLNRQQSWGSNNPSQSNSFKLIQKITNTDEDEDEDQPITEHSPKFTQQFNQTPGDQMRKLKQEQGNDRNLVNRFKQDILTVDEEDHFRYRGGHIPSRVFKFLDEIVDENGSLHNETDPRYKGPAIPSKAFKLLQSMTDGPYTDASSSGSAASVPRSTTPSATTNKNAQVRTIPVQIEGEPQGKYVHPSEQTVQEPKKYTGSSIPGRSFKILQAMTAPGNCAVANEVNESIDYNDPSYINYPYYDPNYPPPPYWHDYYYNYYFPNQSTEPSNNKQEEGNTPNILKSTKNKNSDTNKNKIQRKNCPQYESYASENSNNKKTPRQTPVPFWGHYPPYSPYLQRTVTTPTVESESENEGNGRRTPVPLWGYPPPYYPQYVPTIQNTESNSKVSEQESDQENNPNYLPQFPPYWDPYYYQYYYGYPPLYSPYHFYGYSDNEEIGYSSTDEMAYYGQKFADEKRNSLKNNKPPRIVITPTMNTEQISELSEDSDGTLCEDITYRTADKYEAEETIHSDSITAELMLEDYPESETDSNIIQVVYETETETETEKYSSESDSDTEREDVNITNRRSFNGLSSIKSVKDIRCYENEELIEQYSDDEPNIEEVSDATTEDYDDTASIYIIEDDTMPHQLSVIFEESERTDTSKLDNRYSRGCSVLSDCSTIADKTEEIEDEICAAVYLKLPIKQKTYMCNETDEILDSKLLTKKISTKIELEDTEISTSFTLKSPSLTPKKDRSLCRLDSEESKYNYFINNDKLETITSAPEKETETETLHEKGSAAAEFEEYFTEKKDYFKKNILNKQCSEESDWWSTEVTENSNKKQETDNYKYEINKEECKPDNVEDFWASIKSDDIETIKDNENNKFLDPNLEDKEEEEHDIWSSVEKEDMFNGKRNEEEVDFWGTIQNEENSNKMNIKQSITNKDFCTKLNEPKMPEQKSEIGIVIDNEDVTNSVNEDTFNPIVSTEHESDNDCDFWRELKTDNDKNKEIEKENIDISIITEKTYSASDGRVKNTSSSGSLNESCRKSSVSVEEFRDNNASDNLSESEDDSSDSSDSENDENDLKNHENTAPSDIPEPLSIKDRIKALQDSIKGKQNKIKLKEEINASVKDKVVALEISETQPFSKTTSTKSSIKSFEEYSEEEEGDSGVTSDMSRHISDTEEFPELKKMSRYQRAATHSRLYKLLQGQCDDEDDEDTTLVNNVEEIKKPDVDKFSKLSIRKRAQEANEKEQINVTNKRGLLSLPLRSVSEPESFSSSCMTSPMSNSPSSSISEKLVNELVQSLLKQNKGKMFKNMSMEKLKAAAIKILQEDFDNLETPEDLSSFLSPFKNNSTENSTAAQTPQEFYSNYNEYKQYYDTWNEAERLYDDKYDILPSRAFKLIQEHTGSNRTGAIAGLLAKCPRILSSKNIHKELMRLLEGSDNPTPTPESSLETNEVTSAS